jgi:hypothetical protein
MAIEIGHHIGWRFQGVKSCCWLTCIEMLMQHKHGCIYGRDASGHFRKEHTPRAKSEFALNRGSQLGLHAKDYGLKSNDALDQNTNLGDWKNALKRGPVLAQGRYVWSRIGRGLHVILIAGVSRTGKLAFYNPNIFAVLPHPVDKITYFSAERCIELSRQDHLMGGGPFWQCTEDVV